MTRRSTFLTTYALVLGMNALGCGGLKNGAELSPVDAAVATDGATDTGATAMEASTDTGATAMEASTDTGATAMEASTDGPSDAIGGEAGVDTGLDAAPVPVPIAVAPDHLRLWLTADKGVTCNQVA